MKPTVRQTRILEWLSKAYAHAGRLFEAALHMSAAEEIPCRGRMIAHAYREICSELMNRYSSQSRDELMPLLDNFADEFEGLDLAGAAPGPSAHTVAIENEPGGITVPLTFIETAERVVQHHRSEPKGRARAIRMFEGMQLVPGAVSAVIPTAERWFQMSKYFVRCAHDRKTDDAQMLEGKFAEEKEFFEATLSSFADSAIDNLNELDGILENANQ
jgi:hypothetical protein